MHRSALQTNLEDKMTRYCGIDLSNESTSICVIDEEVVLVSETEIPTEEEAVRRFLGKFKELRCVVEATVIFPPFGGHGLL